MRVPKGKTEQEVLQIIDNVANRLAPRFRFGYYTVEDMKQEARLEAIKGLEKYDNVRPLENFLWVHVRNRLYNLKRNKYARPDLPCYSCPFYDAKLKSNCEEYEDRHECDLYQGWFTRNESKKNLMNTIDIDVINSERESSMSFFDKDFEDSSLISFLDDSIPVEFREDWIRLRDGLRLSKTRKERVLQEIYLLTEEQNEDDET